MKTVTVFVTDRGDRYLPACIASYRQHHGWDQETIVVDDRDHTLGLAGAVREGFRRALDLGADYALWIEEDFVFTGRIPQAEMAAILDRDPTLAQVVLKRQPWSQPEIEAGGIIEMEPHAYTDCSFGPGCDYVAHHTVGDCGFSLNPCLIPRDVLMLGWPDGNEKEMSHLLEAQGWRFAFYGRRSDPPRCTHVGAERSVGWRL